MPTVVIVGASVGGIKTAQSLRLEGYSGEIILIDSESVPAYDKPPLSKAYLQSGAAPHEIALLRPDEIAGLSAEFKLGSPAVGMDTEARTVTLESGEAVRYDALVIATGARARRSPWGDGPGIHVLRTMADADRLRNELRPGRRLLIIGAGFIGAEVASTALNHGVVVTMVDPHPAPMSRVLNEAVGNIFATKHRKEGVSTVFGHTVSSVTRAGDTFEVELSNGELLWADSVLVGIGAVVNTEWLASSHLVLENGVLCGPTLNAIGADRVFAVGDIARWTSATNNEVLRLEHWTNAVDQAKTVAHNIVHPDDLVEYETVEYVWSDQFDWKIQVVGRTGASDFDILGDPADGKFAVLYTAADSTLMGAVVVNWPRALIACRRAVANRRVTDDVSTELSANLSASRVSLSATAR
ncbi:NAD(P)/FAD-dependent oxidoreductase [Leucobacter sp. Z1108]|uniref:NAD(P)/FAD-dependent oxidoreductase n=1 Tax=Microbacteriaceae TaxID=85023 RepID=UPI003A8DEDDB